MLDGTLTMNQKKVLDIKGGNIKVHVRDWKLTMHVPLFRDQVVANVFTRHN